VDANGKKMSKSLGNVVAPEEVIKKHGAEILRLWVSASDYRDDVRISENILKQLSDAYRRIRNTSRFMLGNLFDFDPSKERVPYEAMPEIDRFALHRLQELIARAWKAYKTYEFHVIYHALYNYCIVDLSAFYLDILKDRLYTAPPESLERKSAQTVIYNLLDSLSRIMAPILAFTAEEIWNYMPGREKNAGSVHLSSLPTANEAWKDERLAENWKQLLEVRGEVTKSIEDARVKKIVGHSLDAVVTLYANDDLYDRLHPYADDLRSIFIVSKTHLIKGEKPDGSFECQDVPGLAIRVDSAEGDKCERCWVHDISVGSDSERPTICSRCQDSLSRISPD
jgi:isoleucyl-tRNA synthetase